MVATVWVCVCEIEREDNKPSKTLAMGSLDEIEESERWKLSSGGSAMDLRSVVLMVGFFFFSFFFFFIF